MLLSRQGASVLALGRGPGAQVSLDLSRERWPDERFDAIVHCAARLPLRFEGPEADAAVAEIRAMDDRALDAASACGAHIVYFSTASLYGETTGTIDEGTSPAPRLGYAHVKLATERALWDRGLHATVFRLVAPYGPRQTRVTVLRRFIDAAVTGAPLRYYGTGSRTQDFIHVADVAQAVALALGATREQSDGVFVLASGVAIRMRELAELVVRVTGSTSPVEAAGLPDPEESRVIAYRIDRLRGLGFLPSRSLAEGIAGWAAVRTAVLARGHE